MQGKKIVLTSDETMMSTYHGGVLLGFASILPRAVMPERIFRSLFCPPVPSDDEGRAVLAPCGMRKVEASLLEAGFSRDDIMVVHPDNLGAAVGSQTRIVGITHDDPLGKIAVREIEEMIGRGAPHNRSKFLELINDPLIKRYQPKVVVGGNGAWELLGEELAVDHIFLGEGEVDFPGIAKMIVAGEQPPKVIRGTIVHAERIPVNKGGTIGGIVEIGRGCWRGCAFCSPTMRSLRHRPYSKILEDVKVNFEAGQRDVLLHSDDVLTYGSPAGRSDGSNLLKLVEKVAKLKPRTIDLSHLSLAEVYGNKSIISRISEVVGVGSSQMYMSAWIGIETGSCRILKAHMPNKAAPKKAEDWPKIVRECYSIFCEESWLPVASLVLGLPGEEAEDVRKTIDLVESLMEYTGLILPLFFTPMSQTKLGSVRGFGRDLALPEHWELVGICLEYNLRHLKRLHQLYSERMTAGRGVHAALSALNLVSDLAMAKYLKRMKQGQPPN